MASSVKKITWFVIVIIILLGFGLYYYLGKNRGFEPTIFKPKIQAQKVADVIPLMHWKTSEGINAYWVKEDENPMVDVRLVFHAGSAYDGQHFGLANLTNSLITQGTDDATALQLAQKLEDVGAIVSQQSGRLGSFLNLRSLTTNGYLKKALVVFDDMLTHPNFPEDQLKLAQDQVLTGIKMEQQDPQQVAINQFYQGLYQGSAIAHNPLGNSTSIPAISQDMVKQFYQEYYTRQNVDIFVVGDVSLNKAHALAEELSKALHDGQKAASIPQVQQAVSSSAMHKINFPSAQTTIVLGQLGITRQATDYFPLIVGNYILGGAMNSLLFKTIRDDHGLAYSANSMLNPAPYNGSFMIFLQTRNAKREQALQLAQQTLTDFVANGPTEEQLKIAKNRLIGGFFVGMDSNAKVMANVSNMVFYGLPLNYLDTFRNKINQVTTEQIKQAFQALIKKDHMQSYMVGPWKS